MINYDLKTERFLRNCWEKAYKEGKVLVPIPNSENPIMGMILFNKLKNYRRHVRSLKLNPLYKDQWNRINRCTSVSPKAGDKYLLIKRRYDIEYIKKIKLEYSRHPFNKFQIPKGVEYGTN